MKSFIKYMIAACFVILILFQVTITETTARPQDMSSDVAAAIRLLEQLDNRHGQMSRPRYGKRNGWKSQAYMENDENQDNWIERAFAS